MRPIAGSALVWVAATTAWAGGSVVVDHPGPNGLAVAGLEVDRPLEVRIEAVVPATRPAATNWFWLFQPNVADDDDEAGTAWLLDGATRQPVWQFDRKSAGTLRGALKRQEARVRLSPGRYELYLYAGPLTASRRGGDDFWSRFLQGGPSNADRARDESYVALRAEGVAAGELRRFEVDGDLPAAVVRLNRTGDSVLRSAGLAVRQPAVVRLYGAAEHATGWREPADFGWLIDAETRVVLWRSAAAPYRHAGGGRKNRRIDDVVRLQPGRYELYFGTDGSHAYPNFNTTPPLDPYNWGVSVLVESGGSGAVEAFDIPRERPPAIDLRRAGDDVRSERAFRLARDGSLLVQALGECPIGQRCTDRAWIVEAGSQRELWRMDRDNTLDAGGSDKNRMFDGLVKLPRGSYVLHYASDDSHSYAGWNDGAPFRPAAWGVAAWPGPGLPAEALSVAP
ncbi:MAG TPA: hypothetical protein VJS92_05115 [Candidatus Polarisedimenticolaceae bacterium]|nr:hypothetical protein [Candidatus Polarisedimenticolaceae bacterium]